MRLTLRTLLAYLDDSLEPSQAKLIGQKVAESEQARELIEHIKSVTRRRRITTPPTHRARLLRSRPPARPPSSTARFALAERLPLMGAAR